MLLKSGFVLQKRFLIVRQIAQGMLGATYEAIDKRSRQRVMLKQVDADYSHNGYAPEALEREARTLIRLRHAVLPRTLDYFLDATGQFLVMEFVGGDDLWTLMQQRNGQPFTLNEVLAWADQLFDALAYLHAHQQPVVHRDIKPHNLKLMPRGQVMLVDVGLEKAARLTMAADEPYTVSVQYTSPEQLLGSATDPRSDIFSLGATLYYLLTGMPFASAPDRALALALGQPDPLPPVDQVNPQVPHNIALILKQAMAYHPDQRFSSVAAMREVLGKQHVLRTVVVDGRDQGDYRTIGEALAQVQAGERILVRPGVYNESLVIDKPVSIIGEDSVDEVIVESTNAPCLLMQADSAEVSGLFLRGHSVTPDDRFFAVEIVRGTLILEHCAITSESLACVSIHGAGAEPIIRHCRISGGSQAGIDIYDQAQGLIEHCDIFGNARAGIEISQGADPLIRHCSIHNGHASGVYISDEGRGTVEDCEIYKNMRSGVSISLRANPTIRGCTITYGEEAGVFVYKQGMGTIENCHIIGNAAAGIEIKEGAQPLVQQCVVRDGQTNGIYVHSGGGGRIENCDIFGNTDPNIAIMSGAAPRIQRCRIYDGKKDGLWIADHGEGIIEDCEIYSNIDPNVSIGQEGNPLVRRTTIRNGRDDGVLVLAHGKGQFEDCTIIGHTRAGVVMQSRAMLKLLRCMINQNGGAAIELHKNSAGTIQGCDLRDNVGGAYAIEGKHAVRSLETIEG